MSKAGPLIAFGIGLFVCGGYWAVWEGSREYISFLVINDAYYQLMSLVWDLIPAILMGIGILCLIVAGITSRSRGEVYNY